MEFLFTFQAIPGETDNLSGGRNALQIEMPLRELMRNFFDEIKSIEVNRLGSGVLYDYHSQAWQSESELYKN